MNVLRVAVTGVIWAVGLALASPLVAALIFKVPAKFSDPIILALIVTAIVLIRRHRRNAVVRHTTPFPFRSHSRNTEHRDAA